MKPEDKSKIQNLIGDLEKLRSRNPDAKKFEDWKKDVEKKLEEVFGKSSEQIGRFKRIRFFDFERNRPSKETPLGESERREFLRGLDEARNTLRYFT